MDEQYRTRFPPKEHEEAVRMLMEGIDAKEVESRINRTPTLKSPMSKKSAATNIHNERIHEDRKSLNSSTAESVSSGIVGGYQEEDSSRGGVGSMHSKSTSTSTGESVSNRSGFISGSDMNETECSGELIPSRTIAVQCDLKESSIKRDHLFDASMQASSISSTRYGFYNYTHETLAKRHERLKRSASNRNIAKLQQKTSTNQQISRSNKHKQYAEAPTSMSELSSPSSLESLVESNDDKRDIELTRSTRDESRLSTKRRHLYNSVLDNSMPSPARARINSLPKRPVTALSYVSTNKLRHEQQGYRSDLEDEADVMDEQRKSLRRKNRAISQQSLSRPKTPVAFEIQRSSNHSSDSELVASREETTVKRNLDCERFEIDRSDEMILMNNASAVLRPSKSQSKVDQSDSRQNLGESRIYHRGSSSTRTKDLDGQKQDRENRLVSDRLDEDFRSKRRPIPVVSGDINLDPISVMNSRTERYEQNLRNNPSEDRRFSSTMSLPRRSKPLSSESSRVLTDKTEYGQFATMNRKDRSDLLNKSGRARGHTLHTRSTTREPLDRSDIFEQLYGCKPGVDRTTSMRQVERPNIARTYDDYQASKVVNQQPEADAYSKHANDRRLVNRSHTLRSNKTSKLNYRIVSDHDDTNELDATKTWTNFNGSNYRVDRRLEEGKNAKRIGSTRSMSMRNVNGRSYLDGMDDIVRSHDHTTEPISKVINNDYVYDSSSECSSVAAEKVRNLAARLSPLDYDSQQRLNESGLPEVNPSMGEEDVVSYSKTRVPSTTSYLGDLSHHHHRSIHLSQDGLQRPFMSNTLNVRSNGKIKGRAMSQQSLTRPTMPLSSSTGRRWLDGGGGGRGANTSASSDVGGSSMSLVSKLNRRYENAHTRSPIVMYIPPARPTSSSLKGDDSLLSQRQRGTGLLRKSGSRSRSGSQDRSRRRSVSKNGSDSESSSILKSLTRAGASKGQSSAYSSKRIARIHNIPVNNIDTDDEDEIDGVARLPTEVDTYKFSRRYSVPKDAKINWFARLRQRVTSNGSFR